MEKTSKQPDKTREQEASSTDSSVTQISPYFIKETLRAFITINVLLFLAWASLFAIEYNKKKQTTHAPLKTATLALAEALLNNKPDSIEQTTLSKAQLNSIETDLSEIFHRQSLHSARVHLMSGDTLYFPGNTTFDTLNKISLTQWRHEVNINDKRFAIIEANYETSAQYKTLPYSAYFALAFIVLNTLFAFRIIKYEQLRKKTTNRDLSEHTSGKTDENIDQNNIEQSNTTKQTIELIDQLTIERNELRLAQQTAIQSSQLKSKLIADTSHELMTPLNSIVGFSQLLTQTNEQLSDVHAEYIQRINHNAQHLAAIVNDMLDLSRLESGRLQLKHQNTDVYELLFSIVYSAALDAEQKHLSLITDLENIYGVKLLTDALRLRQIVTNLLSNAIRYTKKGFVSISASIETSNESEWLRLDVIDSGPGISTELRENIFNRYNHEPKQQTNMSTGLGLSITNDLVNAFGGKLSLTQPLQGGSQFTAILPLNDVHRDHSTYTPKHSLLLYCNDSSENDANHSNIEHYRTALSALGTLRTETRWDRFYQSAMHCSMQTRIVIVLSLQDIDSLPDNSELIDIAQHRQDAIFIAPTSQVLHLKHQLQRISRKTHTILNAPSSRSSLMAALKSSVQAPKVPESHFDMTETNSPAALIVDDNPSNVQLLCSIVNMAGCSADAAENGLNALNMATKKHYQLIFVDIRMHPMNGYELLDRLRALSQYKQANIIAVTAHTSKEEYRNLVAAGFTHVLHKPLSIHEVRTCMNHDSSKADHHNQLAKHAKQTEVLDKDLSIFSIKDALQKSGGQHAIAADMLNALAAELEKQRPKWQRWQEIDPEELLNTIHKLHGTAQMTSTPSLTATLNKLETALKTDANVPSTLMEHLEACTDDFIHWYNHHDIKLLLSS